MFGAVAVPTPFAIGPVNAYVAGRTVVDPGPDSDEAWDALVEGLAERDLAPEDLERVLITHSHPDHFGAAARLRAAGADVYASAGCAAVVEDFRARMEYEQTYFADFFERCGMAGPTADTITQLPEAFLPYASSVAVDETLAEGDSVAVDGEQVAVHEAAGHAPGELVFAHAGDAVVGDQVLPHVSPTPFLQPPPEPGAERPRVLPAYRDSLDRIQDRDFDRLLPGHRDPVTDPAGRIDELLAQQAERTEQVREVLDGPTQPITVMEALFEDLPATEQFGGMSEAVGHLDVLEARGEVTCEEVDGEVVYVPA